MTFHRWPNRENITIKYIHMVYIISSCLQARNELNKNIHVNYFNLTLTSLESKSPDN